MEFLQGVGGEWEDAQPLPATSLDIGSKADWSQISWLREIVSRLPDHVQCVLPSEGDSNNTLSLAQTEYAVRL